MRASWRHRWPVIGGFRRRETSFVSLDSLVNSRPALSSRQKLRLGTARCQANASVSGYRHQLMGTKAGGELRQPVFASSYPRRLDRQCIFASERKQVARELVGRMQLSLADEMARRLASFKWNPSSRQATHTLPRARRSVTNSQVKEG